uniref:CLPP5 n=1 Tax=Arundo donax TaxID=35708 RepID=A0A0A9EJJ0_ARUDO
MTCWCRGRPTSQWSMRRGRSAGRRRW